MEIKNQNYDVHKEDIEKVEYLLEITFVCTHPFHPSFGFPQIQISFSSLNSTQHKKEKSFTCGNITKMKQKTWTCDRRN